MSLSKHFHRVLSVSLCTLLLSMTSCQEKGNKDQCSLIPQPNELKTNAGHFAFNQSTVFYVSPELDKNSLSIIDSFAQNLNAISGFQTTSQPLEGTEALPKKNIVFKANKDIVPEGYELSIQPDAVIIQASDRSGIFYAIQTLKQLLPTAIYGDQPTSDAQWTLPCMEIKDAPRFGYRGLHIDVARHFFPKEEMKKILDLMALHKQNTLHWHLTDDQGWRIEIKKYPRLTEIGSIRNKTMIRKEWDNYDTTPYGGFYTQEDIKEVVKYAEERCINIIPEVDLPGHMMAALAAYPDLGCTGGPYEVSGQWGVRDDVLCPGKEKTFTFIEDVLTEVMELFPSEYIHIGGDECPKVRWEKCPKCQARIKELGLKADKDHTAEQRLQSYIINYAEQFLNGKRRQIIGWEEILEGGLAPNATVMSWRGIEGGIEAVKHKHDAIMTPSSFLYFDYYQTMDTDNEPPAIGGYVPLEKVYSYEPVPQILTPEEAKHIVGIQANLWTEYIPTYSQVEYMELPRMAALSEVQWTMPEKKEYADFLKRLPGLIAVYDINQYNYAKHIFQVKSQYIPDTEANVLNVVLSTIDNTPVYYTFDGSEPTASSNIYTDTLKIGQSCTLKAITIRPNGSSAVLKEDIKFNKATMQPITMQQPINEKYKFEGKNTLIDGLAGSRNYRTGRWIAFYQNDLEAVIDLQQEIPISKAWVRTYVEIGEEILDLRELSVAVSNDGKEYKEVKSEVYPAVSKEDKNGIYTHELSFDTVQARYVKITARPEYNIPAWHWGKGRPAFIFVDEIGLE